MENLEESTYETLRAFTDSLHDLYLVAKRSCQSRSEAITRTLGNICPEKFEQKQEKKCMRKVSAGDTMESKQSDSTKDDESASSDCQNGPNGSHGMLVSPVINSTSVLDENRKNYSHDSSESLVLTGRNQFIAKVDSVHSLIVEPLIQDEIKILDLEAKMKFCREKHMASYQQRLAVQLQDSVLEIFRKQFLSTNRRGDELAVCSVNLKSVKGADMLGCKHYARNCKLFAECCKMYVSCRLCHDESVLGDHEMDRFATKFVLCAVCFTEQEVGAHCISCGIEFASYFCNICKFYENTPGRNVYHCDRCNICRRGVGIGIDDFHCNNCDACVAMESKPFHKCLPSGLRSSCPVCFEYLFTSTKQVVFMRCGHSMHSSCFKAYTETKYQCPLCSKSLRDMTKYFEQLDEVMANEELPP